MNITILPSKANGEIKAQPSKSMAHRLIIAAVLAKGKSVIKNVVMSEDIKATLSAAEAFGAKYEIAGDEITVDSNGFNPEKNAVINCNESGSTLRFLIPVALTASFSIVFSGKQRLMKRPLAEYENICKKEGLAFDRKDGKIEVCGKLCAGNYEIRGDVSSQYITGLLFALPLLDDDSVLKILPPVESRSYIDLTFETLDIAKIRYEKDGDTVKIFGNQQYSPITETVEGDFSNAAFPDAFGLIGGDVTVTGLSENSKQGDSVYKEYFNRLICETPALDIQNCPDLAPVLLAVAALKNGATLENTARLRYKESDRGNAMKEELEKFGADITVEENSITVKKAPLHFPSSPLSSHNDHRIAMALSVICSVTGGTITGAEAVNKSYPNYWKDLEKLGIEVKNE